MQDTPILGSNARLADRVSRDWAAFLDAIVGSLMVVFVCVKKCEGISTWSCVGEEK